MISKLQGDPATAHLTPRERALIEYTVALTRDPAAITSVHVNQLRAAGLSDEAIHSAASVTAYFNFVNRIALGLGVELEADLESAM